MSQQFIHVTIGNVDGVFPVVGLCANGLFKDFYFYRPNASTVASAHRRWCVPCLSDGSPAPAVSPVPAVPSAPAVSSAPVAYAAALQQPQSPAPVAYAAALQQPQPVDTDWRAFLRNHWDSARNHCRVDSLDGFYSVFRRAASAHMASKSLPPVEHPPVDVPSKADVVYAAAVQQPALKPAPKPRYVELSLFPDL